MGLRNEIRQMTKPYAFEIAHQITISYNLFLLTQELREPKYGCFVSLSFFFNCKKHIQLRASHVLSFQIGVCTLFQFFDGTFE